MTRRSRTYPDRMHASRKRVARKTHDTAAQAEAAGEKYAQDQLEGDYFMDWVRDQMLEASHMDPSQTLPLDTKSDARKIARNMLQQLGWDANRDLSSFDISKIAELDVAHDEDVKAFFDGFRTTLDASQDWLADELLEIQNEMGPRRSLIDQQTKIDDRMGRASPRRFETSRRMRSSGLPNSISMYSPAQVFINGKYQVTGTMTPSHGPEDEVRILLHITRPGDVIEVKQDENVWAFIRDDSRQGFRNKDAPVVAPSRRRPVSRR